LVGLLVAFAIGLASARLTASLRHLGKSRKVFLSYSRSERELARRITSGLQAAGIKVWIDEEHLLPGAALIPAVDSAMSEADSVVAILSQSPGPVVVHEIQRARASGTPVIPVLSHASDMPDLVAGFQYVDFSDFKQGMSRLINAVQQARRAPDSEPQEDA
jgi:hypothetical protein